MNYLTLNVSIDDKDPIPQLGDVIYKVRPNWATKTLKTKVFTDGISNKLVGCYVGQDMSEEVLLVRIFGRNTELLVDREKEVRTMCLLHSAGLGPHLHARFSNGLCYEFLQGNVGTEEMIRDPKVSELIAKEIAKLHSLQVPDTAVSNNGPCTFSTMLDWLQHVSEDGFTEAGEEYKQKRWLADFPGGKQRLLEEVEQLRKALEPLNCPVVFTHNDILIKNFVLNRTEDRVYLIDYEYAEFNYAPFDIGNHFCEFAGVEVIDHSLYPSKDFQLLWLRHYLRYLAQFTGKPDGPITDAQIERLYIEVNMFSLASHLFWAIWALVQAKHSVIDFDFMEFGVGRYSEYLAKKAERLALASNL